MTALPLRIFIAGPMSTSGEPGPNLHAAANVAAELVLRRHLPFVPHVNWILHAIRPEVPAAVWREWSIRWVTSCDVVFRLPGESFGADEEVAVAERRGIPVVRSVVEVERIARERSRAEVPEATPPGEAQAVPGTYGGPLE